VSPYELREDRGFNLRPAIEDAHSSKKHMVAAYLTRTFRYIPAPWHVVIDAETKNRTRRNINAEKLAAASPSSQTRVLPGPSPATNQTEKKRPGKMATPPQSRSVSMDVPPIFGNWYPAASRCHVAHTWPSPRTPPPGRPQISLKIEIKLRQSLGQNSPDYLSHLT